MLPMHENTAVLREPVTAEGKIIPNRVAIQPMEGADGTADGAPGELTRRRYSRFAQSGAGLIWFEAVAVQHDGRANPRQLWLHEKNADAYKRTVADIRETAQRETGTEPLLIMQATHSGRYSKPNGPTFEPLIACSNPVLEKESPLPPARIITDDALKRIEEQYAVLTGLAMEAGFDGIDIKACHRYLNNELLSAHTRPGLYGGSFENRSRFFMNCVNQARQRAKSGFIVTTRVNIYDGIPYPYGFGMDKSGSDEADLSEPVALIKQLGFSLVNITMGNPYFNPEVNRPTEPEGVSRMARLTGQVKANCPEVCVVSSAPTFLKEQSRYFAAGMVKQSMADIVGFGRMAFAYPAFAKDMMADKFDKKQTCITCGKCSVLMRRAMAGCVVRDTLYTEMYKALDG